MKYMYKKGCNSDGSAVSPAWCELHLYNMNNISLLFPICSLDSSGPQMWPF